jgi:hypothetical protein
VSSSLLAIGREWSTSRYLHAEGPPCLTPYLIFRHCLPADMFHHHRLEIGFFTISVVQQRAILSSFETG